MTPAMPGEHLVKTVDALDPGQGVDLLAGVGEVLAQALVHGHAAGDQLVLEDLLEQCPATAAARAGLGPGLEFGQLGATIVNRRANGALGDVMARADGRGVGQRIGAQGGCAIGQRQDQARRIGRQLDRILHVLQQGVVVAVVAHQHRADDLAAVGIDHQAPIAGVGLIDETIAFGARRSGMGIANGAHIHTQQFELGRHVGTGEGGRALPCQCAGNVTRHGIARRHQAKDAAAPRCTFANGKDPCIAGTAVLVDDHPTTRRDLQAAAATQRVLGANTCREHDQVGFKKLAPIEIHSIAVVFAGHYRLCGPGRVYAHTQGFDLRAQGCTAIAVELHRHQPRGKLHHMRFQAQRLEGIGRFETEQATPNHHAATGLCGSGTNTVQIIKGAIDQTRVALRTVDGRHERVGAGGQHQPVVAITPLGGDHFAAFAIDFEHRLAKMQVHGVTVIEAGIAQRQRFGIGAAEILGQVHTVVGALALLAEHPQLQACEGTAFDQLLHAMMAHHTVADHDQAFSRFTLHLHVHGDSSLRRAAKKRQKKDAWSR